MNRIVYFADRAVAFAAAAPGGEWHAVRAADGVTRAKILKILESYNSVAVLSPDPEAAFAAFAAEFTPVEAAGGIVVNGRGEGLEACAEREIAEETGVRARVVRPLCRTLHAYWFPKTERWELKRTSWYELRTEGAEPLTPQREEGIEQVVWCTEAEAADRVRGAFPTIRCVAEAMRR